MPLIRLKGCIIRTEAIAFASWNQEETYWPGRVTRSEKASLGLLFNGSDLRFNLFDEDAVALWAELGKEAQEVWGAPPDIKHTNELVARALWGGGNEAD